jgi:alpha-L-fucosidase
LLESIGSWLSVNGEAIYGTRPWVIPGEGPTNVADGAFTDTQRARYTSEDIRFTTARGDLYAIVLADAVSHELRIRSLGSSSGLYAHEIEHVSVLGVKGDIAWHRDPDALVVSLPEAAIALPVVKIHPATQTVQARDEELH